MATETSAPSGKRLEMARANVERCRNYDPRPPEGRTENEETIVILGEQIEQMREMLRVARCPNKDAAGHEQTWQCQWCDEQRALVTP